MSNRVLLFLVLIVCLIGLNAIAAIGGPVLPIFLLIAAGFSAFHTFWLFMAQEVDLHANRREVFERLLRRPVLATRRNARAFLTVGKRSQQQAMPPAVDVAHVPTVIPPSWQPQVSVVVPAKNESLVIETTIRHLFNFDYPNFEVIVIDDASDDATPQILARLKDEFTDLHVLRLAKGHPAGKSFVLNEALSYCHGEVVAVFDADAVVNPEFLTDMLVQLEPAHVGAVQAQKRISNAQTNLLTKCQDYEYALDTSLQGGRNTLGGVSELRGNGQLIKMSALKAVGGWNNESITDDIDMTMKLLQIGLRVEFTSRAVVWEEGIADVKGLFRQRTRWAEGSVRRFLDYLVPLTLSNKLNIRQRYDMTGFAIQFVWPLCTAFGIFNEMNHAVSGEQTYVKLLLAAFCSCGINVFFYIFWSIRTHRSPVTFAEAFKGAFATAIYFFALWCPCMLISLYKVLSQKKASSWALTQHGSPATLA